MTGEPSVELGFDDMFANSGDKNIIYTSICQLNGKCGYPGKPYRAKLEPDNKLLYDEGEEVTYQCTDFWSFIKTRKCEKGRWTGEQPRCGDFVSHTLMKDSKLEDISGDRPVLVFEHLNMTITNTTWRYPNAFTSNRFKKARLRINDTNKYKWSFRFTAPTAKLFVRINFNFINYTFLSPQDKENFRFNISLEVSPYRSCRLNYQGGDKWREDGNKVESDFTCDTASVEDTRKDLADPGDYMLMETQASHQLDHELIAVFLGKSYGTDDEPLCGEPEIMSSQFSRFNVQYRDYSINCRKDNYKYISTYNPDLPNTSVHSMKCQPDMRWKGSYPDCVPLKPCSLDNLLVGAHSNQTVITSMDGLYFFNESQYYAVDGTEVNYGCANPGSDILVGKESRHCLKTGVWSGNEPYCYDPNETTRFPVWIIIGILFTALVFIVCLTAVLFYVYSKRIKSKITQQIARNRPESEKFEGYDDVEFPSNKMYDTYDVVGAGGEVRYADAAYYSNHGEYVEVPANVQIQSSNDYWRLPVVEPAYLEMTASRQPSPRPSPKPTPCPRIAAKAEDIYTYEL
ncbi:unnamed protein product [Oppiella nova]|uniref:Sushi domain-containing protein n=1 Tax=Oppiella nova TaxID=334625 RepID=A0A7R9M521_9ACAR|nr:unnamed protein product [Oppiella nova]CAG2170653.1 unnamed protein product [Oppiella nova]